MTINPDKIRQFLIYGLGSISGAAINFLLIPLYLSQYTPAEYGIIHIILLLITFVTLFVSAGMMSAVQSQYFKTSVEQRKVLMGTVLVWYFILFFIIQLVAFTISGTVAAALFGDVLHADLVCLVPLLVILTLLVDIPANIFRLKEKAKSYVAISLLRVLLEIAFKYLFIIELARGVPGFFEGSLAALLIVNLVSYVTVWRENIKIKFSSEKLLILLRLSTPYILTGFCIWSLNSVDRLMLNTLQSESATGIYSLGVQFAQIYNIIFFRPLSILLPAAIFTYLETHTEEENKEFFKQIMNGLVFIGSFVAEIVVIGSLGIIDVIDYYIDIEPIYVKAKSVILILVLSNLLYSICIPAGYVALHVFKTEYEAIVGLLSVTSNVLLNYLLIPRFGIVGAASATLISFCVHVSAFYYLIQKAYPVDYYFRGIISQLVMLGLAVTLLQNVFIHQTIYGYTVKLFLIAIMMFTVSIFPNKLATGFTKKLFKPS